MKKIILLIILLSAIVQTAVAQDTIYGRSPNYYYMDWYDECEEFYQPYDTTRSRRSACFQFLGTWDELVFFGRFQRTSHRLLVKGLSAMVSIDYLQDCKTHVRPGDDTVYLPEYMYLFLHEDGNDTLILLDSVRWDNLTPKIMKLPNNIDTLTWGYSYCYSYEAMFKEPFVVDGEFFIAGSSYSNATIRPDPNSYSTIPSHKTVMYVTVDVGFRPPYPQGGEEIRTRCVYSPVEPYRWSQFYHAYPWILGPGGIETMGYGPFHAIIVIDSSMLEVESADEEMGTVTGGGILLDSTTYYIEALPNVGYKFTHWNDGDVTNPRAVYLTQDTLFTAHFAPREQYEVSAVSSDLARGSVYGGGVYYEEDTATLTAHPWRDNVFTQWDDGDTANPRQVVVTQDTTFTALFLNPEGIDEVPGAAPFMKIVPNPTDGNVSVILSAPLTGEVWVTLQDAAGHEVMSTHIPAGQSSVTLSLGHLPSGSYYATLHHPNGTATEKIVLK